jgi:uncharacterized protein (UPF0335 family)
MLYVIIKIILGLVTMTEVIAIEQLKQYINRIEKLNSDKAEVSDDIKQVFDEAKANGFDIKIMKQVIKLKKLDKDSLAEQEAILELYRSALNI